MLQPGLSLELTTDNPLYRGSYDSKVVALDEDEKQLIITPWKRAN